MPAQIIIPRLGWAMEEGVFVGWLKRDGDTIREGEPLFSLEGEKAVEEVESLDSGILRIPPDAPRAGDSVVVGAVIAYVVQPGEPPPFENGGANGATRQPAEILEPRVQQSAATSPVVATQAANDGESHRPAISPRARRAAARLGVDWTRIKGSGRTGRIRERDIVAASRAVAAPTTSMRESTLPHFPPPEAIRTPTSPLRRTIAERMVQSQRDTAPVTFNTTADVGALVQLRRQLKNASQNRLGEGDSPRFCSTDSAKTGTVPSGFEPADEVPGFTELLIRLTARALALHTVLNSRWEGDEIVTPQEIHIGVAVDTEAGLLVPVLRNVAALTLRQITVGLGDLVARARRRELKPEEMRGGTFTITNLGTFGIDTFTPIINYPECAVLGVGRIVRVPVVDAEDRIVARDRITLSLTFDHRIADGAPAARFLQRLTRFLENPVPWLIS